MGPLHGFKIIEFAGAYVDRRRKRRAVAQIGRDAFRARRIPVDQNDVGCNCAHARSERGCCADCSGANDPQLVHFVVAFEIWMVVVARVFTWGWNIGRCRMLRVMNVMTQMTPKMRVSCGDFNLLE